MSIKKNISLDVDYVKAQFPAFKDPLSSKWAFFENAGGSYVPHNVIKHLNDFIFSKGLPFLTFFNSSFKKNKSSCYF